MQTFRKKPVVVEAMQIPPAGYDHHDEGEALMAWLRDGGCDFVVMADATVIIFTREGQMKADPGDWIIREPFPDDDRRFYPCKPDIFAKTYTPVVRTDTTDTTSNDQPPAKVERHAMVEQLIAELRSRLLPAETVEIDATAGEGPHGPNDTATIMIFINGGAHDRGIDTDAAADKSSGHGPNQS